MKLKMFIVMLSFLLLSYCTAWKDGDLKGWIGYELKHGKPEPFIRDIIINIEALVITENGAGVIVAVAVSPEKRSLFENELKKREVLYKITSHDFGRLVDEENFDNERRTRMEKMKAFTLGAFRQGSFDQVNDVTTYFAKHNEINSWLQSVASKSRGLCKIDNIGQSYEKRNLLVLKCSTGGNKKIIFLDAGIHAREHLAPATLLFIIKKLVNGYTSKKADAVAIFKKFDIHFLPLVNPDGYDFSFTSGRNRYWRKTRKPYGREFGVDANRNFDIYFGGVGTSRDLKSDIYCGPYAFSEPETLALSNYLSKLRGRLTLYISFHTFGNLWLTPHAFTRQYPSDNVEMMRVATAGTKALQAVNGNTWKVGQPANIGLYVSTGGSYDWVRQKLGVKYSFTLELRPKSSYDSRGFLASTSDIAPSGNEVYAAVLATAKALP